MNVTITGTDFDGATGVWFNGAEADFRLVSSTRIETTVPAGATTGRIRVSTPAGTSSSTEEFGVGSCRSDLVLELWPPNHLQVDFDLTKLLGPETTDVEITSITQDEPVDAGGDGNTGCDGDGIGTSIARIRAERSGSGNGRVYRIHYSAFGGACTGFVTVTVPHDQDGAPAVDDGQTFDSSEGCN
jgi:hypothetical protein